MYLHQYNLRTFLFKKQCADNWGKLLKARGRDSLLNMNITISLSGH